MTKRYTIGIVSEVLCFGMQDFLLQEGHRIKLVVAGYQSIPNYGNGVDSSGLVNKYPGQINLVEPEDLTDCDFIVFDSNGFDEDLIATVREVAGHTRIIAPCSVTDNLEHDRAFGKEVAKALGFDISEGEMFDDCDEAITGLERLEDGEFFIKGRAHTLRARNREEAIDLLINLRDDLHDKNDERVYLERKVDGDEIAVGGFLTENGFQSVVILTQEYKYACEGNQGSVLTGEIATSFCFEDLERLPPIFQEAFKALGDLLKGSYCGFVDINTIISKDGKHVWFLEWTTRPGYPTELEIAGFCRSNHIHYGDWLYDLATGVTESRLPFGIGYALSLFANGLGLHNYKSLNNFLPVVTGLDEFYQNYGHFGSGVQLLSFGTCWDGDKVKVQSWDRALFVAQYDSYNLLDHATSLINCWGHSFRKDLFRQGNEFERFVETLDTLEMARGLEVEVDHERLTRLIQAEELLHED